MKRLYANLIGDWKDITDIATLDRGKDPATYMAEDFLEKLDKYGYSTVEYGGREFRLRPEHFQIVTTTEH